MELPLGYTDKFKVDPKTYESKELCAELSKIYGSGVWRLPRIVGFTENRIRKAHEIAVKKEKTTFGYLYGIIKKLKPYQY